MDAERRMGLMSAMGWQDGRRREGKEEGETVLTRQRRAATRRNRPRSIATHTHTHTTFHPLPVSKTDRKNTAAFPPQTLGDSDT